MVQKPAGGTDGTAFQGKGTGFTAMVMLPGVLLHVFLSWSVFIPAES